MVKTWSRASTIFPEMVGPHDRRARRAQARAGIHQRVDGRPQARASSRPTRTFRGHAGSDRTREGEVMAETRRTTAKQARQGRSRRREAPRRPPSRRPGGQAESRSRAPKAEAKAAADGGRAPRPRRPRARRPRRRRRDPPGRAGGRRAEREGRGDRGRSRGRRSQERRDPEDEREAGRPAAQRAASASERRGRRRQRPVVQRPGEVRALVRAQGAAGDRPRARQVRSATPARVLRHSPRGVARDLERLLNSAIANAENNHDLVGRRPVREGDLRGRGPDAEALPAARAGPRVPDPQAHEPPDRGAHTEGVT